MDTIKKLFGANLRRIRGNRTQAEMAELVDLPLRTYQRLDAGTMLPQDATLQQIARHLEVSEISLFQLPQEKQEGNSNSLRELLSLLSSLEESQVRFYLSLIRSENSATKRKQRPLLKAAENSSK